MKVATVENYIHSPTKVDVQKNLHGNSNIFFTFGRMDFWKNDAEVLAIFGKVARRSPTARFVVSGNKVTQANTFRYLEELDLLGRTILVPPMPFEAVSAFLNERFSERGVFLSSSRGESFGLAAIEAMAHGIPVVLSDVRGHKAIAPDNLSLYRLHDISDCAEKLLYAAAHWSDRSNASLDNAVRFQDSSRVAEQWHSAVDELAPFSSEPKLWETGYGEIIAALEKSRTIAGRVWRPRAIPIG